MYRLVRFFALIPHNRIRWFLIFAIGAVVTAMAIKERGTQANYSTYDRMVAQRFWAPTPDAKIVIVDIDEASLDRLRKDFGRWPWPRETLAGALEWLESQKAAAVVFDILFSDVDTLNAASDEAFAEAVAQSRRSYFPVLRLNPANDAISEVRADQLKGFAEPVASQTPQAGVLPAAPTLAIVPPVFKSIVDSTRLGYHNIFPGADGINRHYDLWLDKDGWRLWSLPARMARDMGWALPAESRQLIRFNRKPNAYTTVPFHEVWRLSQTREGRQADARFDGAIVLIGSTASSLFDVKATPVSPIHPGVHVLANAIDNLKHANFIDELPWGLYLGFTWMGLLLMGWASTHMREATLNLSVLVIPVAMLALSFASLHVGPWFIDLASSASQALTFFSLMSVYQRLRVRHFTQLGEAGALGLASPDAFAGTGRGFQACLVLGYPQGKVDVQRLIDACIGLPAVCAVVQTVWLGERPEAQASPAVVQLTARTEDALRSSAQSIVLRETGHATHSHLTDMREIMHGSDEALKNASYNPEQLWQFLAQAQIRWSEEAAQQGR